MKKILSLIVVIMALVFTGMQSANAQGYVTVGWPNPPTSCDCPSPGNFFYRIDIAIVDQCGEDPVTVYDDFQIVGSSEDEVIFDLDYSCLDYTLEPCYLVTAVIRKLCPDGHGGFTTECSGKANGHVSCNDLMNQNTGLTIVWD
jgi:hypothetical protein